MNGILSRGPARLPIKEAESKRKLELRAYLHSLRGSRTAHSWKSEGPYYLPNPLLRGTVERKAPSKQLGRREGAYVFA